VIRSFRDAETEKVFNGIGSRRFQAIEKTAIRKLFQIHAAKGLADLRSPGNSLEALKETAQDSTASRSTTSTACASSGMMETPAASN
jgi:plasmid maintenance system killer protein